MKVLLTESAKEFLRIFLLAVIPVAISQFESGKTDIRLLAVGGIIAVLKALDRGLHEAGKNSGNDALTKSIVRF